MLKFSANPEGRGEYVDSGSILTEDELVMLTPEQQLDYVRNLGFLDTMQFAYEGVEIDNAGLNARLPQMINCSRGAGSGILAFGHDPKPP